MTQYDVTISSKGQLVLPKEVRNKFKLSAGSKIKVIVDGGQIILKPRTIADELEDVIHADITKDGKPINEATIKEYQFALNRAFDKIVSEADEEYKNKQFISFDDLKKENENV